MFAHERAHLRHRHHLSVAMTEVVASANPLLRPVARTVTLSVERWADEDAGEAVGSRTVVAAALARAGLATVGARSKRTRAAAVTMAGSHVTQRTASCLFRRCDADGQSSLRQSACCWSRVGALPRLPSQPRCGSSRPTSISFNTETVSARASARHQLAGATASVGRRRGG